VCRVRCKKQEAGQEGKGLGNSMKVKACEAICINVWLSVKVRDGKARKACVGMVCEAHMGTRCMVHRVKVRHVRHMWVWYARHIWVQDAQCIG